MATGYVLDGNEYDDELNHAVTFRQLLTVRITVHHIVHCAIVAPGLFKLFRSRNMRYSLRRHVRTAATVPVMAAYEIFLPLMLWCALYKGVSLRAIAEPPSP